MTRFLLRRFAMGLVLLFVYVSGLFFFVQIALPGDYVSHFALFLSNAETEALRDQLGLNLPIWQRYLNWLFNLLRGDLGIAYSIRGEGQAVTEIIKNTLPVTLLIFGLGTVIAFLIGQWLGKITAWRGPGFLSGSVTFISIALYTSFPPWLVFLVIYLVVWRLDIPISLQGRPGFNVPDMSRAQILWQILAGLLISIFIALIVAWASSRFRKKPLPALMFFLVLLVSWIASWYILGIQNSIPEILRQLTLPTITFILLSFGEVVLIMRTSMVDKIDEDYIQTAKAKGLPDNKVRDKHAARNALLPVTSRLIISIPFLLSGMVMIEETMNVQGIGTALFFAVGMQNIPLALGISIVIGIICLAARLLLEVMQAALDPRIRSGLNGRVRTP